MSVVKLRKAKNTLGTLLAYDANYLIDTKTLIIGLDEVGRGCLAGPVTTAAFAYGRPIRNKNL